MILSPADSFGPARWIWSPTARKNHYALFARTIPVHPGTRRANVRITASQHYELFVNGRFVERGAVLGDPQWCQYDDLDVELPAPTDRLHVAVLVHHASGTHIHCLIPGPPGLLARVEAGGSVTGTSESWRCLDLEAWSNDVDARGWALGWCEDYDARREPEGWAEKTFTDTATRAWPHAALVPDADRKWAHLHPRPTPRLRRRFVPPSTFRAWRAPGPAPEKAVDICRVCDDEPLVPSTPPRSFDLEALNRALASANAITFDLGAEFIGHYEIEVEAPEGVVLELTGAELLRGDRPWAWRKNTSYSVRYRTRAGRQTFTSFMWNGFRWLHLVARGNAAGLRIHRVGCIERRPPLRYHGAFRTGDAALQAIFDLCRRTLEVGVQEYLIDCPSREQAQYWGDGVFIAQSLWKGFGDRAWLEFFLEGYLHAPFREDGQINSVYPGGASALTDYSLIPLVGQRFHRENTGVFYKPAETFAKAMRLKPWYDRHLSTRGLVEYPFKEYFDRRLITFIDHPGIGWHNAPHPGIDRDGASCPLNTFLYGFLRTLAEIGRTSGIPGVDALDAEADRLGEAIRAEFFDGRVFHDAKKEGLLSAGTSWQTNGLAVYFDLVRGGEARRVMERMLEGYDRLCRCTPYFHFWFLPALRKVGMEREAIDLIKREWKPMVDDGATTTWEGFLGDALDSRCHPWSTAPFLFLLESRAASPR